MDTKTIETNSVNAAAVAKAPGKAQKKTISGGAKAFLAALACLCVYGTYYYLSSPWVSTDDAYVAGHIVAVSPKVAGHIAKVLVDDNEEVRQGQVLAEIDASDYAARLQQARALVAGAKAKLNQTANDLVRYEALAAKDEISKQIRDHAQSANELAEADLAGRQAELRQAELNMSYTKIYAPQDGKVTKKSIEGGTFVNVGQVILAIVPSETWVVANFKETQLKHMRPGQNAEIKVDAYDHKLAGHVDSLQSGTGSTFSLLPPENASGNFVKVVQRVPVKIVLDNPQDAEKLVPGLSVEASVEAK
jgi:membrane fusion protein (multidrug efflux system)